jgi:hydrogenase maturation protease
VSRIVIGLGNPFRRDDAAGLAVARGVRHAKAFQRPNGCLDLLDLWEGAEDVVVVDAMRSGRAPGTVRVFDALSEAMDVADGFASTHGLGLLSAVGIGRALGRMPDRLLVYGIEVADARPGVMMSNAVTAAVDRVIEEVDRA